jgi:alkylated DNA repair dioxygenase AlkB
MYRREENGIILTSSSLHIFERAIKVLFKPETKIRDMSTHIDTGKSQLFLDNTFLSAEDCICYLDCIGKLSLLYEPEFRIFGKPAHMRRSMGFFSDESIGYKFSGIMVKAQPMTAELLHALDKMNSCINYLVPPKEGREIRFNAILVNLYEPKQYISSHSDDEKTLASGGVVAAISFGASRTFRIRNKKTKAIIKDIDTHNGQLIIMSGEFQKEFTHEVLPGKEGVRISYTFRYHTE